MNNQDRTVAEILQSIERLMGEWWEDDEMGDYEILLEGLYEQIS